MIGWWLVCSLAFGQEPAPTLASEESATVEDVDELDGVEEVIVYGEIRVIQAHKRLEAGLERGGYTMSDRKGDRTIYRNVTPWRGKVILHDDGWMKVKRQGLRVEGREWDFAPRNSAKAWGMCVLTPWLCVRVGGFMVSRRRFLGYEGAAIKSAAVDAEQWSARIADLAIDRKLEGIDASLSKLWLEGHSLVSDGYLATSLERRTALLDYWASRTDTVWGMRVREAVAAFIRGEVQYSDTPFSVEEQLAFNEGRIGRDRFLWGRQSLGITSTPPDSVTESIPTAATQ